jgi:DNA polymerase-1
MKRHGAIRRYWDSVVSGARARGWAATQYGRRRRFPEINSANRMRREEAEREAINHPIQGTAADILKIAMVRVAREVPEARLILTVHDELLFEVPSGEAQVLARKVRRSMESAGGLPVPLLVEAATGRNWAECHP